LFDNYWISVGLIGNKQDQNIKFEIRVPNFSYIGVGNAKTEEVAHQDAVKDILLHLVHKNVKPAISKVLKVIIHCL